MLAQTPDARPLGHAFVEPDSRINRETSGDATRDADG
jgi:hypothetical protein